MESNRYRKEETVLSSDISIEEKNPGIIYPVHPGSEEAKGAVTYPVQHGSEEIKQSVTYPVRCGSDDMVLTAVVSSNSDLIYIEDAIEEVVCLSDDCVIKEEVVITSDVIDSVKTYTESYEEVSDNGYESVDSPLSEPDHLTYLFPELW